MDRKTLIKLLVCPKCKGDLEKNISDNLMEGEFICWRCRLKFRMKDGIPNMLIEDAEKI